MVMSAEIPTTKNINLIGHRGQPWLFPENSLPGFAHVLQAGATFIETDIQLSADGVAVLSHDENLLKLTGHKLSITHTHFDKFKNLSAGYAERFGEKYQRCRIASLQQFVGFLQQWPDITCFIELKRASLTIFGRQMIDLVVAQLSGLSCRVVLISFDYKAMVYTQEKYSLPVGWVLPTWSADTQRKAQQLSADYLFVDAKFCPHRKQDLWQGSWEWAVYTLDSVAEIKTFSATGIRLYETNCFHKLSQASGIL